MLVGRARELEVLDRALATALHGAGSVVLLAGEPGVGKTRLATEAAARAHNGGAKVGWGVAPATGSRPFLPWRSALRVTTPAVADLLEQPGGGSEDARFRLFEDVAAALRDTAEPQLLVLDDLQWADPASLLLLRFLSRTLRAMPVLLLGTYRDTDLSADSPLHAVLDELPGAGTALRLAGLSADHVAQLATHLGAAHADPAALHARTGGNPFLVEQLCAAPPEADRIPATAAAVVGQRLRRLSPACRALLEVAAVAARTLELPLLGAALGREPASLLPLVDEALAAGVIVVTSARPPSYRFGHDLMREALVEQLPTDRLAALHWHLGELLLASPDRVDEAARHLQAGVLAGDPHRAADASLAAADQAARALAFEQAADHLDWAVTATGNPPDPALLLRLGEARLHSGDWDRAAEAFDRAAARARTLGDAPALARAALGFGAGLGGFEVRLLDSRQIALLEEAAAALHGQDCALTAFVLARLSVALSFVDDAERRAELSRRAVETAERCGDDAALAYALATYADVVAGPDHTDERLALGARIVALAGSAGDDELTLLGHRFRIVALLEAGQIAALDREIAAFTRLAERYRLPVVRWYVPLFAGMRALMRGDLPGARRLADEAEAIGAQAGSVNAPMLANTLRLAVAREDGSFLQYADEIRATVEPYVERSPQMLSPYGVLIALALAEGDLDEARRWLEAMAALDFGAGERDAEWLGSLEGAVDGCVALADRERAERLYALLLPYAGRFVVDGIAAACLAAVDELLARLAPLLGRADDARRHLADALAAYERTGSVLAARRARRLLDVPVPTQRPPETGTLRRDGELWLLSYAGRDVRLPDAKGLHDLARLLSAPGREVHVGELTGAGMLEGAADVVLDEQARRAYRQRLRSLDADLAEAQERGDDRGAERARAEHDALLDALAEATGLRGRTRGTANNLDRARQAVRARLRHLLTRLEQVHPELARHLSVSLRTGTTCCYTPDRPVRWQVTTADVRRDLTPPR